MLLILIYFGKIVFVSQKLSLKSNKKGHNKNILKIYFIPCTQKSFFSVNCRLIVCRNSSEDFKMKIIEKTKKPVIFGKKKIYIYY